MNIDELWDKYKAIDIIKGLDDADGIMTKRNFTLAILEEISSPVEPEVMQKIAGIRWEQRYSTTLDDDKLGRWMRIGRVNGMTVAIITKIKVEPVRFTVHLPNNKGDESVEGFITTLTEQEAMGKAEKYICEYASNFSA